MTKQIARSGERFIFENKEDLALHVAKWLCEQAMAKGSRFTIALSGGSTPKKLYQILSQPPYINVFPWQKAYFFFSDERFVPHNDENSNYRMIREVMLGKVCVRSDQVYSMPVKGTPAEAALEYEGTLQKIYGRETLSADTPLFDIVLLGLGTDGHTASLFPDTDVLTERSHWVGWCDPFPVPYKRLTLTYPSIASSRHVAFLVTGRDKKEILSEIFTTKSVKPAARIYSRGDIRWFLDKEAIS